jgi:hypothetical protein
MMRIRSVLVGAVAVVGLLFVTAAPASADVVSDSVTSLQSGNLYVAKDATAVTIDQASAAAALDSSVRIAVLPDSAGDAATLAQQIGEKLGGTVTVGVFVGHTFNARSNALCSGAAGSAATKAVADTRATLTANNDITATIQDFAKLVAGAPKVGSCGSSGTGTTADTKSSSSSSSGTSGWTILAVFGVLGAGAIGLLSFSRKRKDKRALADARALIQPFYDRLAADVGSLQPGDNAVARQAMADASERFNSTGSQLSSATSVAQLGGARRSVLEGLQAARTARTALGLDPGPELPPLAESSAPQLTEQQQINVNGQNVQGYPQYQPGAPYYFAGGGGYAGGWYSMPFWQTLLIAEALSPGWGWGFGGGFGGYGYGGGYDSGYNQGYEQGQDSAQNGGGADWGGGGGGDWGGGGGGDWGGGGGGDWGGGGGDSGGGSW